MDLLESDAFIDANIIFSTYTSPEILFHGCMTNYASQNFGVLVQKKADQTYAGVFSPKLILENQGIYFYHPKEVMKGAEAFAERDKERPDPPFNYKGNFKNSLFDGAGIMNFGTLTEKLRFEGSFKEG